jgi:hypothetical protein
VSICAYSGPLIGLAISKTFEITAIWDPDAEVFTTQSDIPGFVVEAETFEELVDLVRALAPEVIAANIPSAPRPYKSQILTRCELAIA